MQLDSGIECIVDTWQTNMELKENIMQISGVSNLHGAVYNLQNQEEKK